MASSSERLILALPASFRLMVDESHQSKRASLDCPLVPRPWPCDRYPAIECKGIVNRGRRQAVDRDDEPPLHYRIDSQ
jgi:hypothetical protein